MPEFTTKLFAPAGVECIIKRASTYEYFFFFLFECRPSRRGAADRVASKVPQMGDTWVWLGSLLHVYCKYVQYVCPGGLSAEKGGLSNVMKTTAAKNHLARAAPRCRPNGKWSTV